MSHIHIPDGVLPVWLWLTGWIVAAAAVWIAAKVAERADIRRKVPLLGIVAALLVTRDTLNIMSMIGVILLFGIVAKNAILLIDFAKWAQEDRKIPIRDALIEAGRIRLRPIVMTSVAIVAGMIPVALGTGEGGDFRAPLGRAVIGGVRRRGGAHGNRHQYFPG